MIDPRPINFILTPENGYPIVPYNAEFGMSGGEGQDEYLVGVMADLDTLRKETDVRGWLNDAFKVR